jgi:hypothetical protein
MRIAGPVVDAPGGIISSGFDTYAPEMQFEGFHRSTLADLLKKKT